VARPRAHGRRRASRRERRRPLAPGNLRRIKAPINGSLRNLHLSDSRTIPWMCNMRADANIKRAVEDAMRCDPDINATDIGVSVHEEVVTLGGFARSYPHKTKSERDAKRVQLSGRGRKRPGSATPSAPPVVRFGDHSRRRQRAEGRASVLLREFEVIAADRRLRLEGVVEWNYIRERSQSALKRIRGVKGITNLIDVGRRAHHMRFAADRGGIALRCRVRCRLPW
jgi:osmotically-inducible protein OsmY